MGNNPVGFVDPWGLGTETGGSNLLLNEPATKMCGYSRCLQTKSVLSFKGSFGAQVGLKGSAGLVKGELTGRVAFWEADAFSETPDGLKYDYGVKVGTIITPELGVGDSGVWGSDSGNSPTVEIGNMKFNEDVAVGIGVYAIVGIEASVSLSETAAWVVDRTQEFYRLFHETKHRLGY